MGKQGIRNHSRGQLTQKQSDQIERMQRTINNMNLSLGRKEKRAELYEKQRDMCIEALVAVFAIAEYAVKDEAYIEQMRQVIAKTRASLDQGEIL